MASKSTLTHMDEVIYPLTTAEQVIVDEKGTRLNTAISGMLLAEEIDADGGGVSIDAASVLGETPNSIYNKLHPVGSIYMTTTSENPSDLLGFGTWELTGKGFKEFLTIERIDSDGKYFTINGTNTTSATTYISRSNSSIDMRLHLINKVAWGDTELAIGNFNLEELGISAFPYMLRELGSSDDGNCVASFTINEDGSVGNSDAFAEASIAKANNIQLPIHCASIPHELMLDSACDKFYWKRIA